MFKIHYSKCLELQFSLGIRGGMVLESYRNQNLEMFKSHMENDVPMYRFHVV